jgi:hypothetical protein
VVGDEAAAAERPTRNIEKKMLLQKEYQDSSDGCPKEGSVHAPTSMMGNMTSRNPVRKASYILSDRR